MCFTARQDAADELAETLIRVAATLKELPGCILWLVARNPSAPNEVWVQELWGSAQDAERALSSPPNSDVPSPADVMALCAGTPRRTDLDPIGGVGFIQSP